MSDLSYETLSGKLRGKKVLLVGGAGFIGHNLALELARVGANVMIADNMVVNNLPALEMNMAMEPVQRQMYRNFLLNRFQLLRDAGVQVRPVDARLFPDLSRLFNDFLPDKVVHLSAISSAVDARKDPGLCFDLQLVTLRNTLELCRPHNTELMFLSSSTVYGDFETPTVDENTRPQPHGIYANGKYMGERLVRTYAHQHGVPIVIIRPSALYGERCVSRRVSQVFVENALSGKPCYLEGGGDGRLDFTYIKDLVDGMVRALGLPKDEPNYTNTFNLTFGNARTIADLAKVLQSVVPQVILEDRPRAVDKPIRGTLSTARAQEVLGFKAQYALETGYKQYCEWYVEQWQQAKRQLELA